MPRMRMRNWSALIHWLQAARGKHLFTIKHIATQATVYLIWRERNSRLHAGNPQPHSAVFKQLDRCVRDIALARRDRKIFQTMFSTCASKLDWTGDRSESDHEWG
ncbi:hypothetical protein F2Q69_00051035 [Brassica cretica]|uniref:Reverse transcriptase zinc-binding domain-containing protein n=1 Tax=Brassica cretica TaxID=69181 RepID=A0A8S9PDH1_BRACR|nr:hypothetical protein F2Q69_00051035 [Brassica cretica]